MATTRRVKGKLPKGYDSWFEVDMHNYYLQGCKFHAEKITYTQVKTYEPDFVYIDDRGFKTIIETKGRFRDSAEARKYKDIKDCLGKKEELVFLFQNPNTPFPRAKKRRDGTRMTHGEWAKNNGFRFFTELTVPEEWGIPKC
jgi:hypothetical protein